MEAMFGRAQLAYNYLRWKQRLATMRMNYWKRAISLLPSEWQPKPTS
jgi:hypothetical protein